MVAGGNKKERSSRIKSKPNYLEAYDQGKNTSQTTKIKATENDGSGGSGREKTNPDRPKKGNNNQVVTPDHSNQSQEKPCHTTKLEYDSSSSIISPESKKTTPEVDSPKKEAGMTELVKKEVEASLPVKEEEEAEVAAENRKEKIIKKAEDTWKTGEKILCFHGPLIYEAKIQNIEVLNGVYRYFIHYRGWNKNWDEWVPQARMLKFSEKNAAIQSDLNMAHQAKINEKRNRGMKRKAEEPGSDAKQEHVFAVPKAPSPAPRARRKAGLRPQRREVNNYRQDDPEEDEEEGGSRGEPKEVAKPPDGTVESQDIYKSKVEIKIKIPDELKSFIVDDWEQITRNKILCLLPAKITVDKLLNDYTRVKTNNTEAANKNNKQMAIAEVTAGLREYFNVMLPAQLLYKQERSQFDQLKKTDPNLVPTKVYGAAHLLRMFTKLGETLVYTPLPAYSVNLLQVYINDILNYIKRNSSIIFSNTDYQSPKDDQE